MLELQRRGAAGWSSPGRSREPGRAARAWSRAGWAQETKESKSSGRRRARETEGRLEEGRRDALKPAVRTNSERNGRWGLKGGSEVKVRGEITDVDSGRLRRRGSE